MFINQIVSLCSLVFSALPPNECGNNMQFVFDCTNVDDAITDFLMVKPTKPPNPSTICIAFGQGLDF